MTPGPLAEDNRTALRDYIARKAEAGEQVASRAHGAMADECGFSVSYPTFMRYWREQVEGGQAPAEPDAEPGVIPFPGSAEQAPAVPQRAAREARESIEYRGVMGTFSAKPLGNGRWKVAMEVEVSRGVAMNLMGQATALLFPQPS